METSELGYEYEYHPTETETFHVELDFPIPARGRKPPVKKQKPNDEASNGLPSSSRVQPQNANVGSRDDLFTPTTPPATDIQILALHDKNPIICYQNQHYHCTWSDMIGTAMYFADTSKDDFPDALLSTDDYHLVTTSRLKLIGQKIKLTKKPGKRGRKRKQNESEEAAEDQDQDQDQDQDPEESESNAVPMERGLGDFRTTNATRNVEIRKQAAFLEKMMDIKKSMGERDAVRTVWGERVGPLKMRRPSQALLGGRLAQTQSSSAPSIDQEIDDLNRRVVRGDADALRRLQEIYSGFGEAGDVEEQEEEDPDGGDEEERRDADGVDEEGEQVDYGDEDDGADEEDEDLLSRPEAPDPTRSES